MALTNLASDQVYSETTFKKLEFTNEVISGSEFSECKFVACDFSETAFQSCSFMDCDFENCTMKLTKLENSTFARAKFRNCNLLGVNWTEANWSAWASKMSSIEFEKCDLKYAVFFGLELSHMKMKHCHAHEANFSEADLTDADFEGSDFAGAIFHRTNLTGANFVGSRNYSLNINDNKTKGTKFSLPEAIRLLYYMDIVIVDPETNEEIEEDRLNDFTSN